MNYYELVVSKTPQIYIPFNTGNNSDVMGAVLVNNNTGELNPVYDYTAKAHGMRSKRIGSAGSGIYDYRSYTIPGVTQTTNLKYFHADFWVYLPNATYNDLSQFVTLYTYQTGGATVYPNYIRLSTSQLVRFETQTATGSEDNLFTSTNSVPLDAWTHIAVQYDNGIKRIWINGVLDAEGDTGLTGGISANMHELSYTSQTVYMDELVVYMGISSKPANFPVTADILERVNFPRTKTIVWDAVNQFWITSGDEQYWNGTQWISMQNMPYRYWNGTEWVLL